MYEGRMSKICAVSNSSQAGCKSYPAASAMRVRTTTSSSIRPRSHRPDYSPWLVLFTHLFSCLSIPSVYTRDPTKGHNKMCASTRLRAHSTLFHSLLVFLLSSFLPLSQRFASIHGRHFFRLFSHRPTKLDGCRKFCHLIPGSLTSKALFSSLISLFFFSITIKSNANFERESFEFQSSVFSLFIVSPVQKSNSAYHISGRRFCRIIKSLADS